MKHHPVSTIVILNLGSMSVEPSIKNKYIYGDHKLVTRLECGSKRFDSHVRAIISSVDPSQRRDVTRRLWYGKMGLNRTENSYNL